MHSPTPCTPPSHGRGALRILLFLPAYISPSFLVQVDVHTSFDGSKQIGTQRSNACLFTRAPKRSHSLFLFPLPTFAAADSGGYLWTYENGTWNAETFAGARDWSFVTADEGGDVVAGMYGCLDVPRSAEWQRYYSFHLHNTIEASETPAEFLQLSLVLVQWQGCPAPLPDLTSDGTARSRTIYRHRSHPPPPPDAYTQKLAGVPGGSLYVEVNGNWVRSAATGNWSSGDLFAQGTTGSALDYGGAFLLYRSSMLVGFPSPPCIHPFPPTTGCIYTFNAPGVTIRPTTSPTSLPTSLPTSNPTPAPTPAPSPWPTPA